MTSQNENTQQEKKGAASGFWTTKLGKGVVILIIIALIFGFAYIKDGEFNFDSRHYWNDTTTNSRQKDTMSSGVMIEPVDNKEFPKLFKKYLQDLVDNKGNLKPDLLGENEKFKIFNLILTETTIYLFTVRDDERNGIHHGDGKHFKRTAYLFRIHKNGYIDFKEVIGGVYIAHGTMTLIQDELHFFLNYKTDTEDKTNEWIGQRFRLTYPDKDLEGILNPDPIMFKAINAGMLPYFDGKDVQHMMMFHKILYKNAVPDTTILNNINTHKIEERLAYQKRQYEAFIGEQSEYWLTLALLEENDYQLENYKVLKKIVDWVP